MRRVQILFKKTVGLLIVLLVITPTVFAQRPEIRDVSHLQGSMDHTIQLSGNYFGTDATQLAVFFGATRATIQTVTEQLLTVKVPAGATYQDITVTRLDGTPALTSYYRQPFSLTFGGATGIDPAKFGSQIDLPPPASTHNADGLYDICMCDLNADGKPDLVGTRNGLNANAKQLVMLLNGSTPGAVSVSVNGSFSMGATTLQVKCGDLNGDGKPDLVVTESGTGNNVYFLRNTITVPTTPSFVKTQLPLPGKTPSRVEIADMDLDGRPDVILSSQATNSVVILLNKTPDNASSFTFDTPVSVPLPGDWKSSDGLAVEDLNGDFRPEIVTSQFITNTDIAVLENKSTPGSVNMSPAIVLPVGNAIKSIKIGDLDKDGKSDIAFTVFASSSAIGTFLNTSSGSLSFGSLKSFATDAYSWGLDMGDLDGDGQVDIVAASIQKKSLSILNNKSTPGSITFAPVIIKATDFINRHVVIGDVDIDGKPDIAFTSIDDNNLNIPASKISVFRNATCMVPEVSPEGPLTICSTMAPVTLTATSGGGTTYEWSSDGGATTTPGTSQLSVSASGDYTVTATSEGGACKMTSSPIVKITVTPTAPIADPKPQSNSPVCIGNSLTLTATPDGTSTYSWKGPENYTSNQANPPALTNFQTKNAGVYTLFTLGPGGCVGREDKILVEAVDVPNFIVSFSGANLICQPDIKTLAVSPTGVPGFTYQWYETSAGLLAGKTASTLSINTTGEYYYTATSTNPSCPVATSQKTKIAAVVPAVADFTLPATACKGEEVSFTNQSTTDPSATVFYAWDFGDSQGSDAKDPKHTFGTATTFTVKLTTSYTNNACPGTASKSITITTAPDVSITNAENTFDICPDASLVLGVNTTFTSYSWSTGSTDATITITEPGTYNVTVIAANGCRLTAEQIIGGLPAPTVTATATPEEIEEGASAQLSAEGLLDFSWTPTETLSNPAIANPVATPLSSTTYTVTGKGDNGCAGVATVQLKVKGEAIVKKLLPGNFFSPNGDAVSPYWTVGKIDEYPQCEVTIYDDKGVKVYNAKPYQNNWDGTFNGKRLPDGVYYYIIRCEGEESVPRSGSITLLR